MKTIFLKIAFLTNFVIFFRILIFAQFGGGSGTESDPYRIYSKEHLEELSDSIIAYNSFDGLHFRLMNDINIPLTQPIGIEQSPLRYFQGYFKGYGNSVTVDFDISDNPSLYNLFVRIGHNSIIDSLKLEGYMFRCNGFAWQNQGTISNCINNVVTSNMVSDDLDYWTSQSGICMDNQGLVTNCTNNSNLYNSAILAGIACSNLGIISNCVNNGYFFGSIYTYSFAGICQNNYENGTIINCINKANITSSVFYEDIAFCGGICAFQDGGIITNCQNIGDIYTKSFIFTGGITGILKTGKILNCSNYGKISGKHNIGGIAGGYSSIFTNVSDTIGTSVSNCFNSGTITADSIVYGIRGDMMHADTISNCLNIGEITGSAIVDTSSNENTYMSNNFYDKQMIPNSFGIGFSDIDGSAEGKLTTQLTGTSPELQAMLGDGWLYAEGCYPIPLGLENDSMALLAATPVYLHFETEVDYNHVDSVSRNFTIGLENNVSWAEANDRVSFSDENVTLLILGMENLTVNLCEYSKIVRINIVDIETSVPWQSIEKCITLYPNPASDYINLNLNGIKADKVEIYDITGKLLLTSNLSSEQTQIFTGNLKLGLYFIKVCSGNQRISPLKFTKN
jgi:hypothetical protein